MNELAPGIVMFDNIFPDSMDYISKLSETAGIWSLASVVEDEEKTYNKNHRDTDSLLLLDRSISEDSDLGEFSKKFYESTTKSILEYLKSYSVNFSRFETAQLLRYGAGQKFDMHIDSHPTMQRTVSLVYYANDGYLGGEIEFPRFDLKIKPKAGQLILFPSNYIYNHTVLPVISGTRFCVVQWIL